jgi:hypothetical protein
MNIKIKKNINTQKKVVQIKRKNTGLVQEVKEKDKKNKNKKNSEGSEKKKTKEEMKKKGSV